MGDKLKIGLDAKRAFYNCRGLGNYSRDTIRILSEQKAENEYFLFTPKTKNAINFPLQPNCKIISPTGLLSVRVPSLWRTFGQCQEIRENKLDIYHGLSHELPHSIKKRNVRTVVTMHDLIFLKHPELFPFFDRYLFQKKYLRSCLIADRIIAISQETKNDLIEYLSIKEQKIDVVYQGCNPLFRQPVSEEEKKRVGLKYSLPSAYLLIVCAIEKRKNHELIINAMYRGKLDIPLVIVGHPSDYQKELLLLVSKYKLEKQVIFLHHVETSELPAIYQLATLFLYPSFSEGFGIPILEALTSGIPVIASNAGCLKEAGGNAALYVSSHEPEELVNAIRSILENKTLSDQMIAEGMLHSSLFSDENIADTLMQTYRKTLV